MTTPASSPVKSAARRHPSRRRRLAASYLRLGNYEKWAEQMLALDQQKRLQPDEAFVVSRYLASKGRRTEALGILQRYILAAKLESVKRELASDGRLLAVALLLDMGQEKRAMALAVQSVKWTGSSEFRDDVVELLLARKRKRFAAMLLTDAVAGDRPDRRSLRQLTWMRIAAGQYLRAFEQIEQLAIAGRLHPDDFDLLVASAKRAKQLAARLEGDEGGRNGHHCARGSRGPRARRPGYQSIHAGPAKSSPAWAARSPTIIRS